MKTFMRKTANIASYVLLIVAVLALAYFYVSRPNQPDAVLANWALAMATALPVSIIALWLNWYSRRDVRGDKSAR